MTILVLDSLGELESHTGNSHPGIISKITPQNGLHKAPLVSPAAAPAVHKHACQASLSITNSQSLLKLMSIKSVMAPNHLILCGPFLLLPSIFPSFRVFSKESVLHIRWPKDWSFSFSISPSNEYSGLISFRIHWFDILAVEGTLKSLLQHHSSKASILGHSAFFIGPTLTSIHDYWKNHSFD